MICSYLCGIAKEGWIFVPQ